MITITSLKEIIAKDYRIEPNSIEEKELLEIINITLDDLYEKESYLIEKDASERNIVFHFGRYFIENLKNNEIFKEYNVDYEYNRDKFNEKKYKEIFYDNKLHRILPDIILHKRGTNDSNILAIEFKKESSTSIKNDYLKLQALTSEETRYKYKIGLSIILNPKREMVKITKFFKGRKY